MVMGYNATTLIAPVNKVNRKHYSLYHGIGRTVLQYEINSPIANRQSSNLFHTRSKTLKFDSFHTRESVARGE